jgi:type I restriction enzyme S subunit
MNQPSRAFALGDLAVVGGQLVSPLEKPYSEMLHVGPEDIESGTGRLLRSRPARELGLISLKYLFDAQAIIYSKIRPNLNKVVRPGFPGLCSADAYPIWPRTDAVDSSFLFHFLRSSTFLRQVLRTSARTGMPKVNREDLQRVKLRLPPPKVQEQIGAIGDEFDRQLSLVSELIRLQRLLSSTVHADVFARRRRARRFESTEWKERQFFEFLEQFAELNGSADREMLSCSKVLGIVPQSEKFDRRGPRQDISKHKVVRRGDLVVDRMLLWDGSLAFVERVSEGVVSPDYSTFRFVGDDKQREFFKGLIKSRRVRHFYRTLARGSNTRRRRVVPADFLKISIAVPDEAEQRALGDLFSDLERTQVLLERKKRAIGKEREAVMHRLFSEPLVGEPHG